MAQNPVTATSAFMVPAANTMDANLIPVRTTANVFSTVALSPVSALLVTMARPANIRARQVAMVTTAVVFASAPGMVAVIWLLGHVAATKGIMVCIVGRNVQTVTMATTVHRGASVREGRYVTRPVECVIAQQVCLLLYLY